MTNEAPSPTERLAGARAARNLTFGITGLRFPLAGAFLIVFLIDPAGDARYLALILALAIEATDALDGFLARRRGLSSKFGAMVDSMADSFARLTEFMCLLSVGLAPLWFVVLLFWRDSLLGLMRLLTATLGDGYHGTRLGGKIKGASQGLCLVWLTFVYATTSVAHTPIETTVTATLIGLAAASTAASGVDYLYHGRAALRGIVMDWNRDGLVAITTEPDTEGHGDY